MRIQLQTKRPLLFIILLLCFVPAFSSVVSAADGIVSVAFNVTQTTIGKTPRLAISISNLGPNAMRSTSLKCISQGTSLSASSISRLPGVIAANSRFESEQYYRAVAPGVTTVHCVLNAVDTVTGEAITIESPAQSVDVSSETRLYFDAYSATKVTTVGQTVFVTAIYGNRGKTTFTNVEVSCPQLGRSLGFVSSRQTQTTLPPGQSGFVEYRLIAIRPGFGPIFCGIHATDTSTNTTVTLLIPPVIIEVR